MARMIESLRISNLGVIAEASVEFDRGLTVLTGETGAGKTMVLTALSLILGERADPALIRANTAQCSVEAIFTVPADPATTAHLDDVGAEVDIQGDALEVIAARTLTEKKSRALLGGRTVPSATLRAFAEPQVAVHGQADQWRLRRSPEQLAILDAYAGVDLTEYRSHFRAWRELAQQLEEWRRDVHAAERAAQERADGLAAIAAIDPQPGEDGELDAQAGALGYAVSIHQDAADAHVAGRLSASKVAEHRAALEALGLPTSYSGGDWSALLDAMAIDKKSRGNALRFVIMTDAGHPAILYAPDPALLQAAFDSVSA